MSGIFQQRVVAGCPYQDKCHPKIFKHVAKIITSKAAHDRTVIQRTMHSEEFQQALQLSKGLGTLCSKSGNSLKKVRIGVYNPQETSE